MRLSDKLWCLSPIGYNLGSFVSKLFAFEFEILALYSYVFSRFDSEMSEYISQEESYMLALTGAGMYGLGVIGDFIDMYLEERETTKLKDYCSETQRHKSPF